MIVTVFRSRLNAQHAVAYYEMASRMRTLAESMPGFMSFKTFQQRTGSECRLSSSSPRKPCKPGGSTRNTEKLGNSGVRRSTTSSRFKYAPSYGNMVPSCPVPNQTLRRTGFAR